MSTLNVKDSSGNWKEIPSIGGYTKDEVNTMLAKKANESHTHTFSQITDISKSMATNGYIKLGSGLILQWGTYTTTSSWDSLYTVNFPIAFPHACLSIVCTLTANASKTPDANWSIVTNNGFTKTYFKWACRYNENGCRWIAIGY